MGVEIKKGAALPLVFWNHMEKIFREVTSSKISDHPGSNPEKAVRRFYGRLKII